MSCNTTHYLATVYSPGNTYRKSTGSLKDQSQSLNRVNRDPDYHVKEGEEVSTFGCILIYQ